jgi:DNA-directed RNA polymerase subunit beta
MKKTGEVKEQEIYLGDFPIMTERGTFIINGVERVVVSQLIRSPGVFFTMDYQKGKKLFGAKIIPNRGAWLEIETDLDGVISVKIDRKRKLPITALFKAFGFDEKRSPQRSLLILTMAKQVYRKHSPQGSFSQSGRSLS